MWRLSKRSEYGLFFLLALEDKPNSSPRSIKTISQKLDLPYRFLTQIAGELKRARLVNSKEGVKGGYTLCKSLNKISLKKMVTVLDQEQGLVKCQRGQHCDKECTCGIKPKLDEVNAEILNLLDRYSVADFKSK
jgi:Rrf2 family protein